MFSIADCWLKMYIRTYTVQMLPAILMCVAIVVIVNHRNESCLLSDCSSPKDYPCVYIYLWAFSVSAYLLQAKLLGFGDLCHLSRGRNLHLPSR